MARSVVYFSSIRGEKASKGVLHSVESDISSDLVHAAVHVLCLIFYRYLEPSQGKEKKEADLWMSEACSRWCHPLESMVCGSPTSEEAETEEELPPLVESLYKLSEADTAHAPLKWLVSELKKVVVADEIISKLEGEKRKVEGEEPATDMAVDDRETRKRKAREKAMAAMKAKQNSFQASKQMLDMDSSSEDGEEADVEEAECLECILCRESNQEPIGYITHLQCSRVLERKVCGGKGMSTESGSCARQDTIQFCSHALHFKCLQNHLQALRERNLDNQEFEGRHVVNLSGNEFLCPLCKALGNTLVAYQKHPPKEVDATEDDPVKKGLAWLGGGGVRAILAEPNMPLEVYPNPIFLISL